MPCSFYIHLENDCERKPVNYVKHEVDHMVCIVYLLMSILWFSPSSIFHAIKGLCILIDLNHYILFTHDTLNIASIVHYCDWVEMMGRVGSEDATLGEGRGGTPASIGKLLGMVGTSWEAGRRWWWGWREGLLLIAGVMVKCCSCSCYLLLWPTYYFFLLHSYKYQSILNYLYITTCLFNSNYC